MLFVPALLLGLAADPSPVAATVNGQKIELARVDAAIRSRHPVLLVSGAQARQLRTEVLNDLIDDLLLKQFLEKNAPKVEAAEIDRQLAAFSTSLQRKGRSLEQFLKDTQQTEAELRESWMLTTLLDGYIRKVTTTEQLQAYHAANREYFDGAEVNVSHILIRVSAKATPVEQASAKEKLQALRKELAAGTLEFAAAARKHSQCPSAIENGSLGWIPRKYGPVDEAFSKAAFALKPGEMSDVVVSGQGYHLIRVAERKPGRPSDFAKCIDEVREVYADEQRPILTAKLRSEAAITITLP